MQLRMIRHAFSVLLVSVALATSSAVLADTKEYTTVAPDGVTLAVQESGNPNGSPIIFIHGLLGSRLNWDEQLKSPELQRHRIITYDLRGHGLSDKPSRADDYTEGRRWADDLAAVIKAAHAQKPVLVGWSLGAAVITNYLASYGDSNVGAVVYVNGVVELKPDQIAAHPEVYRDMTSSDLKTHLDGERAFLGLCFYTQPDPVMFDRLLANAALASWTMQQSVPSMTILLAEGLGRTKVPILFMYGAQDALVNVQPSIARAKSLNARIQSKLYNESGHAPFLEESERFNHDLSEFVGTASR